MLVVFAAPYFTDNAKLFLSHVAALPGVVLGLVGQDDPARLPEALQAKVAVYERVNDALDASQLKVAVQALATKLGPVHRLLGIIEQVQWALGAVRDALGIAGMSAETALYFRDKDRMKARLREAGLPVAKHRLVTTEADARAFASEVGYPVVVKPPAGAAAQTTFRAIDERSLVSAIAETLSASEGQAILEEFVTGQEHSFDAFVKEGRLAFYSISDYYPSPLTVMENPWMQWNVVLPRDYEAHDIAEAGARALSVLGLTTGMCHLEWFRRVDGSLVISEVAARPPGAQIPTLINRAHDVDCVTRWAELMVHDRIEPLPPRRYASGAAYLRGQGEGRVRNVHGLTKVFEAHRGLICDYRLPAYNQEKSRSYEGEGWIAVRHPETEVVTEALRSIVSQVRVELG